MPTRRSRSPRTEPRTPGRRGGGSPRRAAAPRPPRAGGATARRRRPAAPAARPAAARPRARTEITRLLDLFDRAWSGPSWHGPAVLEALRGVTAEEAAARPVATAHSIGELVLHMARWKRAVAVRLGGRPDRPSDVENFPAFRVRDWQAALATLRREHAGLRRALRALRLERLEAPAVPGGSACFAQAHGIVHHDLWHAGQIVLLRRALESRRR